VKLSTTLPGSFEPTVEEEVEETVPTPDTDDEDDDDDDNDDITTEMVDVNTGTSKATSTALQPSIDAPRRRTIRSPVDIALAMQLRPGLGIGADPAWMVRFLMAMFGWLTVLVGQHGDY
jgi:hypothetical protein